MDLGMSYDRAESFRLFQARILEEYDKMVDTDNFVVLVAEAATNASMSAVVMLSGGVSSSLKMPSSPEVFTLLRT